MRCRLWLETFIEVLQESKDKLDASTGEKWIKGMGLAFMGQAEENK